jgi:hypothetical protein
LYLRFSVLFCPVGEGFDLWVPFCTIVLYPFRNRPNQKTFFGNTKGKEATTMLNASFLLCVVFDDFRVLVYSDYETFTKSIVLPNCFFPKLRLWLLWMIHSCVTNLEEFCACRLVCSQVLMKNITPNVRQLLYYALPCGKSATSFSPKFWSPSMKMVGHTNLFSVQVYVDHIEIYWNNPLLIVAILYFIKN